MKRLFLSIARFLSPGLALEPANGVARGLLERAEARAGRQPRQAQELRDAARAYLRVVR